MINCRPSPSKYLLPPVVGYKNHDVRFKRKPAYTFGVRNIAQKINVGPGPAKYLLTDVTRHGKSMQIAHHFGSKGSGKGISDTPTPKAYQMQRGIQCILSVLDVIANSIRMEIHLQPIIYYQAQLMVMT